MRMQQKDSSREQQRTAEKSNSRERGAENSREQQQIDVFVWFIDIQFAAGAGVVWGSERTAGSSREQQRTAESSSTPLPPTPFLTLKNDWAM